MTPEEYDTWANKHMPVYKFWYGVTCIALGLLIGRCDATYGGDFGLAVGEDRAHARGEHSLTLDYTADNWQAYIGGVSFGGHTLDFVGTELNAGDIVLSIAPTSPWRIGFGLTCLEQLAEPISGTRLNFSTSVAYQWDSGVFVRWRHWSHGAGFGIQTEKYNHGWNLLELGLRF
jgi:hypothetical protein